MEPNDTKMLHRLTTTASFVTNYINVFFGPLSAHPALSTRSVKSHLSAYCTIPIPMHHQILEFGSPHDIILLFQMYCPVCQRILHKYGQESSWGGCTEASGKYQNIVSLVGPVCDMFREP